MQVNESYLTKPENVRFIRVWRSMWNHFRFCCLEYKKLFSELRKHKSPEKAKKTPHEQIAKWCQLLDRDGREVPQIVSAIAGFRREFARVAALTLLGQGIEFPGGDDKVEAAIVNISGWENAVKIALADVGRVKELVGKIRPEWNISINTEPENILDLLEQDYETSIRRLVEQSQLKRTKIAVQPLMESGFLVVPADRINKATIESFTYGAMKHLSAGYLESLGPDTTFWLAHAFGKESIKEEDRNQVMGAIGFRTKPGKHIERLMQKNGALLIKAQYALWARAYAETDAAPGVYIALSISQFCDDIGMPRKHGVHQPQNKRTAIEVLEYLTSMELVCVYQPPRGLMQRIRGPIWSRGIISEELRGYKDVFESDSTSNRPRWIPKAFSYAPGPFFANDAWRAYNHYIALVGEGLLKLNANNSDKYAVMCGGYLGILARMNGYRKTSVSVRFLLEKTGLWAVDRKKNPGRMRVKLEAALERLKEVGVIAKWEITSSKEDFDANDLNDSSTLIKLGEPARWLEGWSSQKVIVDWPPKMKNLETALKQKKERYVKEASRRRKRTTLKIA